MDTKKFGTFIAQYRKENQMTQAQLAEKLYVTDKAVSRWERGLGFPDINTLEPLAEALGGQRPGADAIRKITETTVPAIDQGHSQKDSFIHNNPACSMVFLHGTPQ